MHRTHLKREDEAPTRHLRNLGIATMFIIRSLEMMLPESAYMDPLVVIKDM